MQLMHNDGVTFDFLHAMAKELQDHVKNQIAPYKYPRSIHFVDSLPKTTTGKLQRFRLKS
jgi:2-aminobenzoate-CoA ligase